MLKIDFGFFIGLSVAALAILLITKLRQRSGSDYLPYRKYDALLTPAERSFYEVLVRVIGHTMHVFPKMRLSDVLSLPAETIRRQAYLNKIQAKHVDFVLCDRNKLAPVLAIELDDASHQAIKRQARDEFVNAAFSSAGLPLLRIPAKRAYAPHELAALLGKAISPSGTQGQPA